MDFPRKAVGLIDFPDIPPHLEGGIEEENQLEIVVANEVQNEDQNEGDQNEDFDSVFESQTLPPLLRQIGISVLVDQQNQPHLEEDGNQQENNHGQKKDYFLLATPQSQNEVLEQLDQISDHESEQEVAIQVLEKRVFFTEKVDWKSVGQNEGVVEKNVGQDLGSRQKASRRVESEIELTLRRGNASDQSDVH